MPSTKHEDPADLLAQLDRATLLDLWRELDMTKVFDSPAGRPFPSLARDIVDRYETQILACKPIRDALLIAHADRVARLRSERGVHGNAADWPTLLFPRWVPGGKWAHRVCERLGLDPVYAGLPNSDRPSSVETLSPRVELEALEDFQRDLSAQIVECVRRRPAVRGMATMPTGAGKTRVAMDAIFQLQAELGGVILWIALTQEVCEQAARAYRTVYEQVPRDFEGRLHRLWGDHNLDPEFDEGFMVAGMQKLVAMQRKSKTKQLRRIAENVTLVVFDEAHHAIAPTYKKMLNTLTRPRSADPVPLIGLTATPGRGVDPDGDQVRHLVNFFGAELLVPKALKEGRRDPYRVLQARKILSKLERKTISAPDPVQLTDAEEEHMITFRAFPPSVNERVGQNAKRNKIILEIVTRSPHLPTLVFASDTVHSERLSIAWRRKGIEARSITATTPQVLRRRWIEEFKRGELKVLVNYGVLTTGFDAPNLERVIMARPTTSGVLFEQMIGRGLRGPKFGGTKKCRVYDIVDVFRFHGRPKGFKKWELDWLRGKRAE